MAVALFVLLFGVYVWRIATQPPAPKTSAGHDSVSAATDLVPISAPPVEQKTVALDAVSYSPAERALRFQADLGSLPVEGRPADKDDKSSENWHWTYTLILEGAGKDLDGNKMALSSNPDPERPARFYFQASHITLSQTVTPNVRLMVTDGENHLRASSPLTAMVRNKTGIVGAEASRKWRGQRSESENDEPAGKASGRLNHPASDMPKKRKPFDPVPLSQPSKSFDRETVRRPSKKSFDFDTDTRKNPDRVTSPDF